jgi:L-ascorbate metabolism protein UlaG (beta-lactamase superfamily)
LSTLLLLLLAAIPAAGAEKRADMAGQWKELPPLPTPRHDLALVAVDGRLFAISGAGDRTTDAVEAYAPQEQHWHADSAIPRKRGWFGNALLNGRIWCIGGVGADGRYLPTVEIYDPPSDTWHNATALPKGKAWLGAAVLNNRVLIAGGARGGRGAKSYEWLDEVQQFVPAAESATDPEEVSIRWWGCMAVEVNFGETDIVFDPFFKPQRPRFEFILLSHHHYDHCHEPTLRKLTAPGSPLRLLLASRCCFYASRIPGPNKFTPGLPADLSYVPRDKCMALYPKYMDLRKSGSHLKRELEPESYDGPREIRAGRLKIEAFRSHEDGRPAPMYRKKNRPRLAGPFPNLGYLVTDTRTGISVAHTGDLWNAYPQMKEMRGRVDILFYPLGKLSFEEKRKMMDYIRPQIAVPTHFRLIEKGFPIPGAHWGTRYPEDRSRLPQAASEGWYCGTPEEPLAEIDRQRKAFAPHTRVIELTAGHRYVLPDPLSRLEGRNRE